MQRNAGNVGGDGMKRNNRGQFHRNAGNAGVPNFNRLRLPQTADIPVDDMENGNWRQRFGGNPRLWDGGGDQRGDGGGGRGARRRDNTPGRGGHRAGAGGDGRNQQRRGQEHEGQDVRHPRNQDRGDNENRNQRHQHPYQMGFRSLEPLAKEDVENIITKINEKKDSFINLLNNIKPMDPSSHNLFVLIMELLAKLSQSSFVQLKLSLMLKVCDSQFVSLLSVYLMKLPSVTAKKRNELYWNNQAKFWTNFVTFFECLLNHLPSTAFKCKSLMDIVAFPLSGLAEKHGLTLPEEIDSRMSEMRNRFNALESEKQVEKKKRKLSLRDDEEPPEDFRELSVLPTRDDLLQHRPFLRPNIVQGRYKDVDHYLDVQFRLLREDCLGPLRDGINQFIEDPKRKKFDNIKVYRNVKFLEPYIDKTKIGSVVQLDESSMKRFGRINWTYSKRFIFGSLLLFTKDNCRSFIAATILERDEKLLKCGKIPISIVGTELTDNLYNDDNYVMIESEVYFEPYFHVLKALQDPSFPQHLAMKKYIVDVDPEPHPPAYLNEESVFTVSTRDDEITFKPLQDDTWPSHECLGLNESQHEAFKLALTHEFAVIQGPPGTGKTHLGVKVAETLLKSVTQTPGACLMLIICYTNHALDQFLEAILTLTTSIARIGGQSKNEAMEKININKLRNRGSRSESNRLYFEQKNNLKQAVRDVNQAQEQLEQLDERVLSYETLKAQIPEVRFLGEYYRNHRTHIKSDPLAHWLFQHRDRDNVVFQNIVEEYFNPEQMQQFDRTDDEEIRARTDFILDDFGDMVSEGPSCIDDLLQITFSVSQTEQKLKNLMLLYMKSAFDRDAQRKLQQEMIDLKSYLNLFNEMKAMGPRKVEGQITDRVNFAYTRLADRWALYFEWAEVIKNSVKRQIRPLQLKVQEANTAYEESRMVADLQLLRGTKVIGMTTSGAARLRKMIQALAPPIVIIEEAAEVLEQHIVTALTRHCQHLILIGDHQQLRPSAAHMRLARHFNIEISLFERMLTNGMHSRRLRVQHRMRPEFADLICPHIYEDLENHHSVTQFPPVRGMTDDLFFMTHDFQEEDVDDSASKTNQREGDLTLALANYLMQQGYQPEDVTILAAYSGQMFYMRKQRSQYMHLAKVKITVLDNYQGEESKIILLSLVRNNKYDKIGFLGTENRICVALSRAREGLYIFGNLDLLKRNAKIWEKIAQTLEDGVSVGSQLILRCEAHRNQVTTVTTPEDFALKAPEGGCVQKCGSNLLCGHQCPLVCHGYDRDHVNIQCNLMCERISLFCELGHVCPLKCNMKCQPCAVLVEKLLPCGHRQRIPCHKDPADPTVRCHVILNVTLPDCNHEAKKKCHVDIKTVKCPVPCNFRVECGHECRLRCHVKDDPDHEKYFCQKPCAKAKKGCTANLEGDRGDHQCQKLCSEPCVDCTVEVKKKRKNCTHSERVHCNVDVDQKECQKKCARTIPECGHHCKKKCSEPCGDCKQIVEKTISECGHKVKLACGRSASRDLCTAACERVLTCGHCCVRRCKQPCDVAECKQPMPIPLPAPCGHKVTLPCNLYRTRSTVPGGEDKLLLENCSAPCGVELECGHTCAGTCGACRQGRLHQPCAKPCSVTTICGHQCKEPCKQLCPPCSAPCDVQCPHSRCNKLCGQPCVPCQEPCSAKCPHGACSKRCGEACARVPCDQRCRRRLPCKHRCRGLCGEPCPDACQDCRPEDFPRDILGDELEPSDRIILLQDCGHIFEVDFMDGLVKTKFENQVKIPTCPLCRKPIINTFRYKDFINEMFKMEVDPIKLKVYGDEQQIKKEKEEMLQSLQNFKTAHQETLLRNSAINDALRGLEKLVKNQKKMSLPNVRTYCLYINILDMIGEKYQKYTKDNLKELKQEFFDLISILCKILSGNIHKISQQLQKDIMNEIKRMNLMIALSRMRSHPGYIASKESPDVVNAVKVANTSVLTWGVFNEDKALDSLNMLQDKVKTSGITIAAEERAMIVKAMGMSPGHWYKCPNGHFYCIGECGGAMQRGKCPDCGAGIGGASHRLDAGNSHAREMDGSTHPAWSEHYNNMANFNIDLID